MCCKRYLSDGSEEQRSLIALQLLPLEICGRAGVCPVFAVTRAAGS